MVMTSAYTATLAPAQKNSDEKNHHIGEILNTLDEDSQAVARAAKPYGMELEALKWFDGFVRDGKEESDAAWMALYEWDLLDFAEEGSPK